MMNKLLLGTALLTTSCATQATLAPLRQAQMQCQVQHDPNACNAIPVLQQAANDEANHNGMLAAGIVLLLPVAILAIAAAGANDEPDVVVVRARNHRW